MARRSAQAEDERAELTERLHDAGLSDREIAEATRDERFPTLAVELSLGGRTEHSLTAVSEAARVPPAYLRELLQAIGRPNPPPRTHCFTDEDIELARIVRSLLDAGLPREEIIEIARVFGQNLAQIAEALRQLVGNTFIEPGDSEHELGLRYAEVADRLTPLVPRLLDLVLRAHLRDGIQRAMITDAERRSGKLADTREVAVAFADFAGYTELGNRLASEELGSIAGRLGELATRALRRPVRIVKMVGDAVMFVSPDVSALVATLVDLRESVAEADPPLPQLRIGVSHGPATARAGDWYGATVNLASRIAESAKPGQLLVTEEVVDLNGDGTWQRRRRRRLKGVEGRVRVFSHDDDDGG
jgi:adenylate cyclase